jgi:hypothetical protein
VVADQIRTIEVSRRGPIISVERLTPKRRSAASPQTAGFKSGCRFSKRAQPKLGLREALFQA